MSKNLRKHEWAQGDVGSRTVCGRTGFLASEDLARVTVHDLGDVDVAERCKNCERTRAMTGTSNKHEEATA